MLSEMMWHTQDVLHKKPQVVPGLLLTLAGGLIVYRHMTYKPGHGEVDALKTFLAMIALQMLPLVILETKIMRSANPVGLFCKFATPVTLIHAFFLGMRLIMYDRYSEMCLYFSAISFVVALVTMVKGFRQNLKGIMKCYNVWGLIMLALVAAFAAKAMDDYMHPRPPQLIKARDRYGYIRKHVIHYRQPWNEYLFEVLQTSERYTELIAFVPAVLMAFREDKQESRCESPCQIESASTKRVSTAFFVFLVSFYIMEDLGHAYTSYEISGLASLAHLAHFSLLVDFASCFLAHIYNPGKLVGDLRKWLPIDFTHEI